MNDLNSTSPPSGKALKIILPLLILALGVAGFLLLMKMKSKPEQQPPEFRGQLVEVSELQAQPHQVQVRATGTVQAEQEIALVPEVSGKVAWLSPKLVNGGFFQAGEVLLKIEADDFRLAVERARAEVARAEVALTSEQERAKVARQEWQRIDLPNKGEPGPLVTREIQLQQERANLAAAQAAFKQSELNLQRTEIRAPFNGRIRQETVDLGQYLRAGTPFGSYAGTDQAEIMVPLAAEELRWLQVPKPGAKRPGSVARINRPGGDGPGWQGTIVRSLGEIDPVSRMAMLVVAVDDPYQLRSAAAAGDLSQGTFVEVRLLGATLEQVVELPRRALREDNQVWVMDSENRLRILPLEVVRREAELVVARATLNEGAKLVVTPVAGATDGLLLRTAD